MLSPRLWVEVHVVSRAFNVRVEFWKKVIDPMMEQAFPTNDRDMVRASFNATTWVTGSTGTHGGDGTYVLSAIRQHMDEFLDEYLRVNEPACSP